MRFFEQNWEHMYVKKQYLVRKVFKYSNSRIINYLKIKISFLSMFWIFII